mmetsp:Transcript_47710/g.147068  ORF Transcript_47710/g.147068 Transcript_47710/m.147068 type:complete len:211 (-) Transcript_47710:422-1054(-)
MGARSGVADKSRDRSEALDSADARPTAPIALGAPRRPQRASDRLQPCGDGVAGPDQHGEDDGVGGPERAGPEAGAQGEQGEAHPVWHRLHPVDPPQRPRAGEGPGQVAAADGEAGTQRGHQDDHGHGRGDRPSGFVLVLPAQESPAQECVHHRRHHDPTRIHGDPGDKEDALPDAARRGDVHATVYGEQETQVCKHEHQRGPESFVIEDR